ncbi:MAG TPA: biopolymer transporter ExbD [Terriglobales bacterium]|nr:biopolymer transporter ExbD [Terriglobales bacterium]
MAFGRKTTAYNSDINVTPMVDVMLVLLIIFMVITPMLQKGQNVQLAKTNNPIAMEDADKEDAILVAITREGKVWLDVEQIGAIADLGPKVQEKLENRSNKEIFIKADQGVKYGVVVEVVDAVRTAGVDQVGLLTEQVKAPGDNKPTGGGGN